MKTMIDRPRGGLRPPDLRSMRFCLLVIAALVALPGRLSGGDGASVTITGKVVDRETKQPVRWCHIVPGIRSTRKGVRWDAAASVLVRNGRYQFKCPADAVPHVLKADGDEYQIAISKEIPGNAGTASIDFELTKLPAFAAIVLTPDRKPAVGAEVAVVLDNSPLVLHNGDSNVVVGSELSCQTDAFGEFQFRSRRQTIYLAITHPSGYAFFRPALNSKHRSINLDPWTRVEGTLRFDGKPLADTTVRSLTDRAPALDFDPATLFVPQPTAQTDADGRFVLDHLLYGSGRIGFRIPEMPGSHTQGPTTICWIATKFPLGQTVRIEFGGPCRSIVGKLQPPPGLKTPLRWSGAKMSVETESTKGATQNLEFETGAASDGTFRINGVPAGQYKLEVNFMPWNNPNHYLIRHIAISSPARGSAAQPLDLGVLTLETR